MQKYRVVFESVEVEVFADDIYDAAEAATNKMDGVDGVCSGHIRGYTIQYVKNPDDSILYDPT